MPEIPQEKLDPAKSITIQVKVPKIKLLRMRIGGKIIQLGAWIAGSKIGF